MEHFITGIKINNLHHLKDLKITLDQEKRQHLLLTGKNGSGKTSLLLEIRKYLTAINNDRLNDAVVNYKSKLNHFLVNLEKADTPAKKHEIEKNISYFENLIDQYCGGIEIDFKNYAELDKEYAEGRFITAYYPAERKVNLEIIKGVQEVTLENAYDVNSDPGRLLLKYMVHLKTQQSFARNEGNDKDVERIQLWFDRLENAFKKLLEDDSLKIQYDYKDYTFKIIQNGRNPSAFNELSDGYASVLYIVSDLILRMDKNWLKTGEISEYNAEGIALIDELETHLHIELQKKILPFLTCFFPNIQFIVTTHSPYILNSVENAKAYDLEKQIELENLSAYKADDLAEGYFDVDDYSYELKNNLMEYKQLAEKTDVTEEERVIRAKLRYKLKEYFAVFPNGEAKDMFEDIEKRRMQNDKD